MIIYRDGSLKLTNENARLHTTANPKNMPKTILISEFVRGRLNWIPIVKIKVGIKKIRLPTVNSSLLSSVLKV